MCWKSSRSGAGNKGEKERRNAGERKKTKRAPANAKGKKKEKRVGEERRGP